MLLPTFLVLTCLINEVKPLLHGDAGCSSLCHAHESLCPNQFARLNSRPVPGPPGRRGPPGPKGEKGLAGSPGERGQDGRVDYNRLDQLVIGRMKEDIGCSIGLKDKLNSQVTISSSWTSGDRTDSTGSWCGRAGGRDWIEIKFKTARLVAGIVTQGNPSGDQWVRTFKVLCGNERGDYTEYTENGVKKIFQANSNRNSKAFNIFADLLSCRSIRIVPNTWHSQPCLRMELLHDGCYASQVNNFYVKSQGANDGWRCHIYVNGVEKAVRGRGFCVVIFNPTTGKFNSDTFDTHAKSASETTRMIKFLDNANEYSIVAIAVGDAASSSTRVQPTLITKLHEFGAVGVSCDLRTYAFRDSFAFISQKLPSNSERPAWVSCQHVKRYGGYAAVHATIKTTKYFVDN